MKDRLLAVVGPTAVGKSALALKLATRFGGEIISADSRQVYRLMDVGTAKSTSRDRLTVPHHIVDVVNPDEPFGLASFLQQARQSIEKVQSCSRLPMLVGGTGQYVWAVLEGWQVPVVPPDQSFRDKLQRRARIHGHESLFQELLKLDQDVARRLDPRNVRRVIRALEVYYATTEHGSDGPKKRDLPYEHFILGLDLPRSVLYRRIDDRVDSMINTGWVEEVRSLLAKRYSPTLPSLSGVGYAELIRYLNGETSLETAVEEIKFRTHRLARHQYSWFRPMDPRISWFNASPSGLEDAAVEVGRWLEYS